MHFDVRDRYHYMGLMELIVRFARDKDKPNISAHQWLGQPNDEAQHTSDSNDGKRNKLTNVFRFDVGMNKITFVMKIFQSK